MKPTRNKESIVVPLDTVIPPVLQRMVTFIPGASISMANLVLAINKPDGFLIASSTTFHTMECSDRLRSSAATMAHTRLIRTVIHTRGVKAALVTKVQIHFVIYRRWSRSTRITVSSRTCMQMMIRYCSMRLLGCTTSHHLADLQKETHWLASQEQVLLTLKSWELDSPMVTYPRKSSACSMKERRI